MAPKVGGGAHGGRLSASFQGRLLNHMQRYAQHHDVNNLEAMVQHLRKTHDVYARIKLVPFRKHVQRALEVLHSRRTTHGELALQVFGQCWCICLRIQHDGVCGWMI